MSDNTPLEDLIELIPSKSSVLTKVPPDVRRELNRALLDRLPMTFEGVYNKFSLDKLGVSFTAFYYYGRRIRLAANLSQLAKLPGLKPESIPTALEQTILQVGLDYTLAPKCLPHVARAYRDLEMAKAITIKADLARMQEENWQAREQIRNENRIELENLRRENRIALEHCKAQHKRDLAELRAQLAQKQNPYRSQSEPASPLPITNSQLPIPAVPAQPSAPAPPSSLKTQDSGLLSPRYGRHPDGRPRTRQEFLAILRPQVCEVYGIDPPKFWPALSPQTNDPHRSESEPRAPASGQSEPRAQVEESQWRPSGPSESPGDRSTSDPRATERVIRAPSPEVGRAEDRSYH